MKSTLVVICLCLAVFAAAYPGLEEENGEFVVLLWMRLDWVCVVQIGSKWWEKPGHPTGTVGTEDTADMVDMEDMAGTVDLEDTVGLADTEDTVDITEDTEDTTVTHTTAELVRKLEICK